MPTFTAQAVQAPVGQGFTVTPSDLAFILKQIKIAEAHSASLTVVDPCGTLVGPGANQIPDRLTAYGLRTVDGSCNNLFPGRETFAGADAPFPRLTTPIFSPAEDSAPGFGPIHPTSYAQKKGSVFDSQPRVISNLIVDQTSTNPAAVAAAEFPVRTQGNPGLFPCTTDPQPDAVPPVVGVPANCVPAHQTLFIPNVTTDVGLSPPYNSLFTFFGQFFDHGVDQTVKSGGTVFVPLKADDPLIPGPDHVLNTADDLDPNLRFMVLTRAQNQPGPDGILGDRTPTNAGPAVKCDSLNVPDGCDESADDVQDANNTDTPWVDQSQTYTSHASHQVFLREYALNAATRPVSTGRLLGGLAAGGTYFGSPDGRTGIGTWAAVKLQAATKLGLKLVDTDVANVPMIATDPYGKFIPGPARGLPEYVTATGLVEGNISAPVPVPANVRHFDTPFLTDIAHNADPGSVGPCTTAIGTTPASPAGCLSPDADATPSADFANQPAGTYDDEMLNSHFSCGDGRCNENIALSTIHQIFHSEHDRLVADIKNTLTTDTTPSGVAALAEWKLAVADSPDGWNGERLFQAARFVNEMEYQHLVFEEFGRKVQPAIRPFHVYSPDINPAIKAEFAHAVYRFGHSMLDDTVARTNTDASGVKSDNSVPLLTAFLNPPEYFNSGTPGAPLTPEQAAGSVVMGSSDQVGNELDEFVTETLRNNLLGLPLDLPVLNLTRAREAGVPPLNDFRRQIFATTNDGQLAPYTSWSDFGQHLKHPESLINFVAAYGKHPSITSETTLAGKRAAAKLIVDPANPVTPNPAVPADASDFMFSTGAWSSTAGVTNTGLDDVDLWVGGLAEVTNLNGGLLGSTFNYVFQTQLENLQDGDRLYYLNRTPGMNLRSQLEGNSFSELIQRNTDNTNTLKADAFATADCKFQMSHLNGTAADFTTLGSTVADDVSTTDCDESKLLLRKPDGTIQYKAINSVDPSGINGQSVYNGTSGVDRVIGGNDNDTFWGGGGGDIIEGGGGDDIALGGDGNDIITDLSGADVLKGGPGNDALDGGIGNDIFMGGDGQDFINGGANDNESFAGPGNDFIIAGQGADAVFGDGGDDWIQGGTGQDLLQGDHGAPFFDDPAQVAPGNDIFIGQPGENDYDAEGGDDIMSQNAAIDRNAGAAGFDWAIHQYDTVGANDDMNINNNLLGLPVQVVVNRDRWQETEADSGSAFDDVLRGTTRIPATLGGAGFVGCDVLDQAGVDRIKGLAALMPQPLTGDPLPVAAASVNGSCPTSGPIWGEGDILLGGAGNDLIEGRGGNDIIDGNKSLEVHITVRTDPADPATETGRTDLMEHTAAAGGTFGAGTAGMTLQQAVFAGLVDPGHLVAVREIVTPPATQTASNINTAVFSDARANYDCIVGGVTTSPCGVKVLNPAAPILVVHARGTGADGTDTLTNMQVLQFADSLPPGTPTIGAAAVVGSGAATVAFAPAAGGPATGFSVQVVGATAPFTPIGAPRAAGPGATNLLVTGLTNGVAVRFKVLASNLFGSSPFSALSNSVTPSALPPLAPPAPTAVAGNASASVTWAAPAVGPIAGPPITSYVLVTTPATVGAITVTPATVRNRVITGLTNGTSYTFQVRAVNADGTGPLSAPSAAVIPRVPVLPTVTARTPGVNAFSVSQTANVTATFGGAVTGVTGANFALRLGTATTGAALAAAVTPVVSTTATRTWTLNPTATLAADTLYTATVSGVRDAAGNTMVATSWSFTTGPAPTMGVTTPAAGATGVVRTSNITATFSEPVIGISINSVKLVPVTGTVSVPAAYSFNIATRVMTLNPTGTLAANTQYRVTINGVGFTTILRDVAGNPLLTRNWAFTTGAL